jgi:AAA+ superfamily predicted ATPase
MAKVKKWRRYTQRVPPFNVKSLSDLIDIAWYSKDKETGDADWFKLWKLVPELTELEEQVIGLPQLKEFVVDLVIHFVSKTKPSKEPVILNTVLYGPPGTGKTLCSKILAKILAGLGRTKDKIVHAKLSDFKGKYIGYSEDKTNELLDSANGGILFIDESYGLGYGEDTDTFAKSIIDNLVQALLDPKRNLVCIMAGYYDSIQNHLFSVNDGLKSRFPHEIHLAEYSDVELAKIFQARVKKDGWSLDLDTKTIANFIGSHKTVFVHHARSVQIFYEACRKASTRRLFGCTQGQNTITKRDMEIALIKITPKNTTASFNPMYA